MVSASGFKGTGTKLEYARPSLDYICFKLLSIYYAFSDTTEWLLNIGESPFRVLRLLLCDSQRAYLGYSTLVWGGCLGWVKRSAMNSCSDGVLHDGYGWLEEDTTGNFPQTFTMRGIMSWTLFRQVPFFLYSQILGCRINLWRPRKV